MGFGRGRAFFEPVRKAVAEGGGEPVSPGVFHQHDSTTFVRLHAPLIQRCGKIAELYIRLDPEEDGGSREDAGRLRRRRLSHLAARVFSVKYGARFSGARSTRRSGAAR